MKAQIAEVLNQEMDRKEFLRYAAVTMLMLAGGGMIMQALGISKHSSRRSNLGYGSSSYGGTRR